MGLCSGAPFVTSILYDEDFGDAGEGTIGNAIDEESIASGD